MAVNIGAMAPPIALADHNGNRWHLSDHLGAPVLVVFHRHLA